MGAPQACTCAPRRASFIMCIRFWTRSEKDRRLAICMARDIAGPILAACTCHAVQPAQDRGRKSIYLILSVYVEDGSLSRGVHARNKSAACSSNQNDHCDCYYLIIDDLCKRMSDGQGLNHCCDRCHMWHQPMITAYVSYKVVHTY